MAVKDFKELDNLIKDMGKKFGEGSVFIIGEKDNRINNIEFWKTNSLTVNDVMGGGIPKGRPIEVFGPESAGKTSLCCFLAGQVQQQGGVVAYIDAEHALDIDYAKSFGFDVSRCIFNQPDFGEQALDVAIALAESGKVDLIVIDSLASLVPKSEMDGEMSDQQMGAQARMLGKFYRKITSILGKNKCSLIMINQLRMKLGVIMGNPEVTPGGAAPRFYSSIRLDIRRKEFIEVGTNDDKECIGIVSKIKAVKNKVGTPFKFGNLKILYGKGFQVEEEYIDFGLNTNVLERKGTWYFWDGISLGQGKEKTIEYFKNNPQMYEKLKKDVELRLDPKYNLDGSAVEEEKDEEGCNDDRSDNRDSTIDVSKNKKENEAESDKSIESKKSEINEKISSTEKEIELPVKKRGRKSSKEKENNNSNEDISGLIGINSIEPIN